MATRSETRSLSILSGRILNHSGDHNEVIALLNRHRFGKDRYHELGLSLKLTNNTLKAIEKDHGQKTERCFTECLDKWLRKADCLVNPTIDTLIAALREIGENAVADAINEERQKSTIEELDAVGILERHEEKLLCLNGPRLIVTLLQKEGILKEESVTKILEYPQFSHRVLFMEIHHAVREDHKSLRVFARLLCMTTGNEDLGNEISMKCSAANIEFGDTCTTNPDEEHLPCLAQVETISVIVKNAETIKEVDSLLALQLEDVIKWRSFKDGKAIGSIPPHLATLVIDAIQKKNIMEQIEAIDVGYCSVYDEKHWNEECQKMEKIIAMEKELNKLKQELLSDQALFDEAHKILLKMIDAFNQRNLDREKLKQELYNEIIYDELYQKLVGKIKELQDLINLENELFHKETYYDEVYQKLVEKIDEFDEKNFELQNLKQELYKEINELKGNIDCLEKDKKNLKENALSLRQEIKVLQKNESHLKEQLEMKDKIVRVAIQENEKMRSKIRDLKQEQQKENENFQDKILSLEQQLLQNQAGTNNPLSEEASIDEESTNQPTPIPQQQEYDPHTESITVSNSEFILTAPSLKTCKEIQIQDGVQSISLHDVFADSASAILLRVARKCLAQQKQQLQPTKSIMYMYLHINRTPLSHDSVHSIVNLLERLKALRLTNISLPPTSLSYILNVLLTNESLEEFIIQFNSQMILPLSSTSASSYAQAISDVVRRNSTLQYFSALGLRLDEAGVVKILHALANNNITLRLLTLDQSHQETAYRFSEANGPIKDRLSFS